MSFFAVQYQYAVDDRVEQIRPDHRAYLRSLAERGALRASGPYVGVGDPSALLIFEAASEGEVRDLLAHDPFQQEGLVVDWSVTEWNPVIGVFATA